MNNRFWNAKNPYQGDAKKVLCVCSAGLLRSPTAAVVLANPPFNYNTRAAGIDKDFALIPVDEVLIEWADEIVCMSLDQQMALEEMTDKPVHNLDIADDYERMNPTLVKLIKDAMLEIVDEM